MKLDACEEFLLRYVRARLPAELERQMGVSDIVQSVLFAVSRRQPTFRGTTDEEFQAWISRIARNKIVDGLRRYRARKARPKNSSESRQSWREAADAETPSACLSLQEDVHQLIAAIGHLPDDVRRIVSLRYADGWTFEQIAQELQLPVSTCRRRWMEGCESLRRQLQALV